MTLPHNWKRRYVHGRVGVQQRPLSPGVSAYKAKRRTERAGTVQVRRSIVEANRLVAERRRAAEAEQKAKRLVRSGGHTRLPGETWHQAWLRSTAEANLVLDAQRRIQAKLEEVEQAEAEGRLGEYVKGLDVPPVRDQIAEAERRVAETRAETAPVDDRILHVDEVARILGMPQVWVRDHAQALGGFRRRFKLSFHADEILAISAQMAESKTD